MSKYVYSDNNERFDIEEALTITKGIWNDRNPSGENRLGLFVASGNDANEVKIASKGDYVCGVVVRNDEFLGLNVNDPKYCVVQSLGLCVVRDDGTLAQGDKCMPSNDGIASLSQNNLGFRVVGRIDRTHVEIIISPNNDMISRIKESVLERDEFLSEGDVEAILNGTYVDDDTVYDDFIRDEKVGDIVNVTKYGQRVFIEYDRAIDGTDIAYMSEGGTVYIKQITYPSGGRVEKEWQTSRSGITTFKAEANSEYEIRNAEYVSYTTQLTVGDIVQDLEVKIDNANNRVNEVYEMGEVFVEATQRIEKNASDIKHLDGRIKHNSENIEDILLVLQGHEFKYETDDSEAFVKEVPSKALKWASLDKIGGKSRKSKNLLNPTLQTTTLNGVTCTRNADGTYTLNGTASARTAFKIGNCNINTNMKMVGCPSGGSNYLLQCTTTSSDNRDNGNGVNLTGNGNAEVFIIIYANTVCNNLVFKPMLTTDTSLTYDDYEPYWDGIRHGKTDDVVSKGKNLFNHNATRCITIDSWTSNNFLSRPTSTDFYFDSNGNLNGTAQGYRVIGSTDLIHFEAGRVYYIKTFNMSFHSVILYNSNGSYNKMITGSPMTITPSESFDAYVTVAFINGNSVSNGNIMVIASDDNVFSHYRDPIHFPIPQTIRDLHGYGWSVGNVNNYIDFERKKFVQRVGAKTFKGEESERWVKHDAQYYPNGAYYITVSDVLSYTTNCLSSNFNKGNISNDMEFICGGNNTIQIGFYGANSVGGLKTWFSNNPTTFYYELAEPIETDISEYFDDNFIEVEPYGTITFHQEDDVEFDVPSEVTYMIPLLEDVTNE